MELCIVMENLLYYQNDSTLQQMEPSTLCRICKTSTNLKFFAEHLLECSTSMLEEDGNTKIEEGKHLPLVESEPKRNIELLSDIFPQFPRWSIRESLKRNKTVEDTIESLLGTAHSSNVNQRNTRVISTTNRVSKLKDIKEKLSENKLDGEIVLDANREELWNSILISYKKALNDVCR